MAINLREFIWPRSFKDLRCAKAGRPATGLPTARKNFTPYVHRLARHARKLGARPRGPRSGTLKQELWLGENLTGWPARRNRSTAAILGRDSRKRIVGSLLKTSSAGHSGGLALAQPP